MNRSEFLKFHSDSLDEDLFKKLEGKNIIATKKNKLDIEDKKFKNDWYRGNGNSLHIIIPTLRCNFTCKYCYAYRRGEDDHGYDMTDETLDKTVDFIFKTPANSIAIEFSGGEPLLRFDLVKRAVLRAEKLKEETGKIIDYAIVTNAVFLDEEKLKFIRKYQIGICLSFDGVKEVHDFHRKITKDPKKSTYEIVKKKMKWLKEDKKYPFVFAIPVITNYSFKKWKGIIDEYIKLDLNVYRFKYISHFGFASEKKVWKDLSYDPEDFVKFWKRTIMYIIKLHKNGVKTTENILTYILRKLIQQDPGFAEMQIPCGATIGQIVYDYDGSIYPCDEARTMPEFKIGSVHESSYRDVLTHSTTKAMVSSSSLVESCYNCAYYPFCGVCLLELYKMDGTFISNIPNSYRCKIHKSMFDFVFEELEKDDDFEELMEALIENSKSAPRLEDEDEDDSEFNKRTESWES